MDNEVKIIDAPGPDLSFSAADVGTDATTTTPAATPPALDWKTVIPEKYQGQEFVKNIIESDKPNKMEMLLDQFTEAQKRIGEKATGLQVPAENATAEEWKAFHKAVGVSENLDDYTPDAVTWEAQDKEAGEYLTSIHDTKMLTDMKAKAQELGLTPKQFKTLSAHYDKLFVSQHREVVEGLKQASQQLDDDFNTLSGKVFGNQKEAALREGKRLIDENIPAGTEARRIYDGMNNEQAAVVAAGIYMAMQRYIGEDKVGAREGQTSGSGLMTGAQHQAKANELLKAVQAATPGTSGYKLASDALTAHYQNIPKERLSKV